MDTPLEESNLALIGTDEDRLCKKAAAETEVSWEGAGQEEGVEVWRVENTRDENDNPKFGINPWPKERYGEFYNGDSYIVLQTVKDVSSGAFRYDIYFWIGAESSQDEYGVASYKAVELDDLFGDAPIQHREVQHYESEEFLKCFKGSVKYFDGGIDSGFRHAEEGVGDVTLPSRLYHVRKCGRATKSIQVQFACDSLNHGDAFVLDNGNVVYTWFGEQCSPFERSKAAEVAHNLVISRSGHATLEEDVGDNDTFFDILGGKGDIKEKDYFQSRQMPDHKDTKLYVLSDADSFIKVKEIAALQSNLESSGVCLVDTGDVIFVWIGSGSSLGEQSQAMRMAQKLISALDRGANTKVVRVLEGQESRNVPIKLDPPNDKVCKCVDCEEDEVCGGLWKANRYPGNTNTNGKDGTKVHIVVSHCKSNLGWISDFTKGYEADIASIHVITKCGVPVEGAPDNATLEVLPNVGRCDHTYAHYITTILDQKVLVKEQAVQGHGHSHEKDSIVVFLKDNQILHQGTGKQNNFESMVRLASSSNGFACGVLPTSIQVDGDKVFISAYHEVKKLFEFTLGRYRKGENTQSEVESFESVYRNIGVLYNSLGAGLLPAEVVQVCYGGIFAASVPNIKNIDWPIWEKVEQMLSRGDNIQEGHYME